MLRLLLSLVALFLLTGWSRLGPALGSRGCAITHYNEAWIKANGAKATWTGPCKDGYASGVGKMTLTTTSGATETYEGQMVAGNFSTYRGSAVYQDGTTEYRGDFSMGSFTQGTVIRNGAILFEGTLGSGYAYKAGKLRFASGQIIDGQFVESASVVSVDGRGVKRGRVLSPDGQVAYWIDSEKVIRSEAEWIRAGEIAAAREVEEARLDKKRTALRSKLFEIRKKLYEGRQYTELGTAADALQYYTEGMELETVRMYQLDRMLQECAEPCIYTGVLQQDRREAADYYKELEANARKQIDEIEEGRQMAQSIASFEQAVAGSGLVSSSTVDLYNQTKARNEVVGDALNRLAGSDGPSGFAQILADTLTIVHEVQTRTGKGSARSGGLRYDIDDAKSDRGATVYRFYDLDCVRVTATGKTLQGDIEKVATLDDCPMEAQFFYRENFRNSQYDFTLISRAESPKQSVMSGYAKALPIEAIRAVSCPSTRIIEETIKGHCSQNPIFKTEPFAYCECNVYNPVGTAN